ncbi:MAG TPA: hypothetical protein VFS75_02265 [Candidatus Paceibacterota bacterium]|nr:hypothetical protein [Candidatus Paceibacterota bacterium]
MRIIAFICLFFAALYLPLWLFALGAVAYAFTFRAYELLVLAVLIDAEFGEPGTGAYRYTASVAIALLFAALVRPYLRFYA